MARQAPGRGHELAHWAYANRRLVAAIGKRLGIRDADLPDLMQRVAVTLFRRREAVLTGCEQGFLAQVARREAQHLLRGYRRRAEVADFELASLAAPPRAEEYLQQQRELRRLRVLFAGVAKPLRDAWLQHVLGGAPCHEVAALMGLPVGTVKSRVRRVWAKVFDSYELSDAKRPRGSRARVRAAMCTTQGSVDAQPGIG
jgi:RNA polymerase sigma-70 factor, ECF subfamily